MTEWDALRSSVTKMRSNSGGNDFYQFAFGLVLDEMTTIELASAEIEPHDEGTSYCTSQRAHGDEVHPYRTVAAGSDAASKPRACSWSGCGKVLHAAAGFIEVTHQPTGDLESYCSLECLHWQLHEELR